MWNWSHLKGEGLLRHSMRAAQMAGLLLLSGAAMLLHVVLPFWQQPKFLRAEAVAESLTALGLPVKEPNLEPTEDVTAESVAEAELSPRAQMRRALRRKPKQ